MRWPTSDILREQLLALVDGHGAHMPLDAAVADFPDDAINRLPPNVPYTPWHLLEHVRIAQRDILDYIRDRAYLAPGWPEEYWPARDATATPEQFALTVEGFRSDRRRAPRARGRSVNRSAGNDPEHPGAHDPSRGAHRRRPQRLPHRRVRDPPPGHGNLAARPGGVGRRLAARSVRRRGSCGQSELAKLSPPRSLRTVVRISGQAAALRVSIAAASGRTRDASAAIQSA